ncbi:MAG: hypothetical protein U9R54_07425, partial [Bacteroidota bacterium]|nr:hypothetical protein [Bacteroidota bacterium]
MLFFGKTWWGEQWLNSLSNIDFSNRLPRGKSYARNDYVKSIKINKNIINAKVRGSQRNPYNIKITIPEFSDKEKTLIINLIKNNPLVLSQLLNKELPHELYTITKENNINVFPSSWKDFNMHCSCPDIAVPCKHIASVIYIISAEIDKNPFIIFELHGLDIINELEKAKFPINNNEVNVPAIKDFFLDPVSTKSQVKENIKTKKHKNSKNKIFDFSNIPIMLDTIFSILDEKPIFYEKDFKPILKKSYKALARYYKRELQDKEQDEVKTSEYEKYEKAEIIFHNEIYYSDAILYSANNEKHFSKNKGFVNLLKYINNIPAKYINRLSDSLQTLYYTYHFSLKLIENSAFIPQLLELADNSYIIRWIPASINKEVDKLISEIEKLVPTDMVQILSTSSTEYKILNKREQIISLISMFLGHFVLLSASRAKTINYETTDAKIEQIFFTNSSKSFNKLGEKEIPNSINQWISR